MESWKEIGIVCQHHVLSWQAQADALCLLGAHMVSSQVKVLRIIIQKLHNIRKQLDLWVILPSLDVKTFPQRV